MKKWSVVVGAVVLFVVGAGAGFVAGGFHYAGRGLEEVGESRLSLSLVESLNTLESLRLLEAEEHDRLRVHLHTTLADSVSYARHLAEEGYGPDGRMTLGRQQDRFATILAENQTTAEDFAALAEQLDRGQPSP